MKTLRFTVYGKGQFPLDMLRYDSCWPRFELEARVLAEPKGKEIHTVHLCKHVESHGEVTPERWASFGWTLDLNSMEIV